MWITCPVNLPPSCIYTVYSCLIASLFSVSWERDLPVFIQRLFQRLFWPVCWDLSDPLSAKLALAIMGNFTFLFVKRGEKLSIARENKAENEKEVKMQHLQLKMITFSQHSTGYLFYCKSSLIDQPILIISSSKIYGWSEPLAMEGHMNKWHYVMIVAEPLSLHLSFRISKTSALKYCLCAVTIFNMQKTIKYSS